MQHAFVLSMESNLLVCGNANFISNFEQEITQPHFTLDLDYDHLFTQR